MEIKQEHTDSKPLARGQRFNANGFVLCASSLSSLLIKSLFWFLFDRSKAFDLLNPLYLVRCWSLSFPITTGPPANFLKRWFYFGAPRDFAQPEFILAYREHLPAPTLCPHFVKRHLLTCIDEDINHSGEYFFPDLFMQGGTSHLLTCLVTQTKHSWGTAAQTWILVTGEFI